MDVFVVNSTEQKRQFIEKCDSAFPMGLLKRKDSEEIFKKIDKYAIFFGIFDEGEPIGYAAVYVNDQENKVAFITMIGVIDNMQRQHVGSALMKRCIVEAKKCGMKAIRLEVLNTNSKAIAFYQHWGFVFEKKCSEESKYLIKQLN